MTAVFRSNTRCQSVRTPAGNACNNSIHRSRVAVCAPASPRSKDSLRKPATILLGAAALVISLVPAGTFKLSEAAPLAAIATGGAMACLAADKQNSDR